MSLYTALLFFSILIPFILSFDKKVSFYRIWKSLLPSSVIVGAIYIAFDILFVKKGIWGFNPEYHSGIIILGLPAEEWLFFILIPYSCIFIHYVYISYFPALKLSRRFVIIFSVTLILILLIVIFLNSDKAYTLFNFSLLILALLWAMASKSDILPRYYLTFLIILVPFFIINSILTGTFIESEAVWYNNSETLGIRLGTVPVEDIGYAFSLILLNLLFISEFQKYFFRRNKYVNYGIIT